ncbi:MAG: phosphoribosylanthranilate isomerase [Bacteroidetes bacterium]|nr:phosphoribosylanthranilate isomerase [Bacteroidota bacterium]
MKIKVCGLKYYNNLQSIISLGADYVGLIFHESSPRYVGDNLFPEIKNINTAKKVGVFVDASLDDILNKIKMYQLNLVQLHGNESPEFCNTLKKQIQVIKAFPVLNTLDLSLLQKYSDSVDYFLFDTKTATHGGSGKKFDWRILNTYNLKKPFFLSGGISLEDANEIKNLNIPSLFGIDINSRFESEPGLKNTELVKQFINQLQNEKEVK